MVDANHKHYQLFLSQAANLTRIFEATFTRDKHKLLAGGRHSNADNVRAFQLKPPATAGSSDMQLPAVLLSSDLPIYFARLLLFNTAEKLDRLALSLLEQLLFCTGTAGMQRFWMSLFDGEVE